MSSSAPSPAFYAAPARVRHRAVRDWWVLLHPPYTLWHLSYVAIGACLAPTVDGVRLLATVLAFALALGVGAHALDELTGRPLATAIPGWVLVVVAAISLAGAAALGVAGISRVGVGLVAFIVVGVVLAVGYNLELFGGRLHTDALFALAWGSFPVLTAYYAQAETIRVDAVLAAVAAYFVSDAQRHLSTPARTLRRRVTSVSGEIVHRDGRREDVSAEALRLPLEMALRSMAWGMTLLALALVAARLDWF